MTKQIIINFPDESSRDNFFDIIESQIQLLDDCGKSYYRKLDDEITYQCPDLFDGDAHNLNGWWNWMYNHVPFGMTFEEAHGWGRNNGRCLVIPPVKDKEDTNV